MKSPLELDSYLVRRQVFKIFGGGFHIYDGDRVVAYAKQKAFKLKEDIRIYAGEDSEDELLTIQARQVIDFSACYDIVDAKDGTKVGAARRKGLKSMLRDSWELLDENDQQIAKLEEDSTGMALLRRFLSNLIPQRFHITAKDSAPVALRQHFNPFIYRLEVSIPQGCTLDRRLILGTVALIAAIEGRQG